jgi:multiple antibiotic resistance protein
LRYLGISLEALKLAGGLLLFKIALDMIFARLERETDEEHRESHVV